MTSTLEIVLENTSDAILFLDRDWKYTYLNDRAELLLRRKRGELLGRTVWAAFPDLLNTPAETHLRRAAQIGMTVRFEQFLPGLYAWHEVRAVPVESGLILFAHDVTDRARAVRDEAVRAGIRNILENAPVAIMLMRGSEHRVELQNAEMSRLLGGRDVEGMTMRHAFPELEGQGLFEMLDTAYAGSKTVQSRETPVRYFRDASGEIYAGWFDLMVQPLFETNGQVSGILMMVVEVTDRLREQEQRQHQQQEQRQASQQ